MLWVGPKKINIKNVNAIGNFLTLLLNLAQRVNFETSKPDSLPNLSFN
jgi:hypothetical protein